ISTAMLPALGYEPGKEGIQAEGVLLEAVTGLTAAAPSPAPTVKWEGIAYRVDLAAPELARLTDIRAGQEGNTLDTALTLTQIGRDLESAREIAQVRSVEKALRDLLPSLVAIEPSELTTAEAPPDVEGLVRQALQDLERVRSRSDLKRAVAIGE